METSLVEKSGREVSSLEDVMTRINVVPVSELCDEHLIAEYRELTRIPNNLYNGKAKLQGQTPAEYTLGKGHVRFFYDKLAFLHRRYAALRQECVYRRIDVGSSWNMPVEWAEKRSLYNWYEPTEDAKFLNRERIKERMETFTPTWTGYEEI